MVQSASSSNTQWPSACWKPRTPCVADAMLDSRIFDSKILDSEILDSWTSRAVAFTESISLDCSDSCFEVSCLQVSCLEVTWTNARQRRSSLSFGGQNQIGGAITGPDRSLDGRRQSRSSPVAGEEKVLQRG